MCILIEWRNSHQQFTPTNGALFAKMQENLQRFHFLPPIFAFDKYTQLNFIWQKLHAISFVPSSFGVKLQEFSFQFQIIHVLNNAFVFRRGNITWILYDFK